ncbi:MAG: 16S rRNA (uracil(1498)-N(3))-methyltransferase [Treponema sp.]|nr:16S rRNA (uracil(1498)-N(3))-methyltransferase [Candidatus Treponema caballi]
MRQFICPSSPDASGRIRLSAKDSRYLLKVLRQVDGDIIDARLPDGTLSKMRLVLSGADAFLVTAADPDAESSVQGVRTEELSAAGSGQQLDLWLFQFLPRPQKMDLIVRQAAECGVTKIVPILGDFSVKNDADARLDRWERIIREARQQSGSAVNTVILPVMSVEKAVDTWNSDGTESAAFVLHESPSYAADCLFKAARSGKVRKAAVAVGCEGGMSDRELEVLMKAGFEPLHFVTNVLRAETAALYGLAVVQQVLVGGLENDGCNKN